MDDGKAALDLTLVIYDSSSYVSLGLAFATLSPILLMPAYAAVAVLTRELFVLNIWAGQLACEAFSWIIKRMVKQDRPPGSAGNGYGFPSSHSQYMGYFASYLMLHLYFRHRFVTTGSPIADRLLRLIVYLALLAWAGIVCYSRYHLKYHSPSQILWGLGIGIGFGVTTYYFVEFLPARRPQSFAGKVRRWILENPLSTWLRLRDGWAVWGDGGREEEWQRWRVEWEKRIASNRREESLREKERKRT